MSDDIRVPREPTDAMMQAGYKEFGASMYSPTANRGWGESAIAIYKAMLLAAPPAAQPTGDGAKLVSALVHAADEQSRSMYEYVRDHAPLMRQAANWIEQHDTQTAQPDSAQEADTLLELLKTTPRVSRFDGGHYDIFWRGEVGKVLVHLDNDTHEVSFSFKPSHPPQPVTPVEGKE